MRFELCLQMVMSRLRVAFVIVQILLRFRVLQLDSKDVVWFFFRFGWVLFLWRELADRRLELAWRDLSGFGVGSIKILSVVRVQRGALTF